MKQGVLRRGKTLSAKRRSDLLVYCLLLVFPVVQFLVFYVCVNFNSILLAFKDYTPILSTDGQIIGFEYKMVGLKQFKSVIADIFGVNSELRVAIKNSLFVYAIKVAISTTLSLLFSYYIFKKFVGSEIFKVFLFIPSIVSGLVMCIIFANLVDRIYSQISFDMTGEYAYGLLSREKTRFATITFFSIWASFGSGILMYTGTMSRISPAILEAGKIDGTNHLQEFIHIIIPLSWSTISTLLVVGMVGVFTDQNSVYSFYGASYPEPSVLTLGYWTYRKTQLAQLDEYPYLSAFGLLETLIIVPITLAVRWAFNRMSWSDVEV